MRLAPRSDFANLEGIVHLAAGGESPPLHAQYDAVRAYLDTRGHSSFNRPGAAHKQDSYTRCKALAAALLETTAASIAFCSSTAEGASQIALSLSWQEGDNVVVEDVEFLSTLLPWTRLRGRGVEVRVVRHADWTPDEPHIRAAVDAHTRLIAVSQVNYLSGIQHNLAALRTIADRHGALLVVDASHAFGATHVPVDLCDFVVSATYKWPLGCQGVALLVWNQVRVPELEPAIVGWRSIVGGLDAVANVDAPQWKPTAERLEPGNPPWLAIAYLETGLAYLDQLGMDQVAAHNTRLSARMNEGLSALGLPMMTPADARYRAGNNCFWQPQPERMGEALAQQGILVSGYSGRMRFSTHIWNDEHDIDTALVALGRIITDAPAR